MTRGFKKSDRGIHLHLTINPCSNTTLNAMRPKSISLKHRNRKMQFATSSLPHSRHNMLSNYLSPGTELNRMQFDSEYLGLRADANLLPSDFNTQVTTNSGLTKQQHLAV